MKNILFIGISLLFLIGCSKDYELENPSENLLLSISKGTEYRGVFTTNDGSTQGKLFIYIPNSLLAPTAVVELSDGNSLIVEGERSNSNAGIASIHFENEKISFDFTAKNNAFNSNISNVLYLGELGEMLAFHHTERAPVTPIDGTYQCTTCGGSPYLNQGQTQTFNFVFIVPDGTGQIVTQVTLGSTVYNGIGYQNNCVVNGVFTTCDIESGDGSTTTTGFTANGNPVIWTGNHLFNNEPTGANDCSGASGTWQWQSISYGLITGTLTSNNDCSTELVFEDFEDSTIEYSSSIPEFTDGNSDYFIRTDGSNISSNINYSNTQGGSFFGAQDIDGEGAPAEQNLLFSNLDVTSISTINFNALFAEDDDGSNQDWDNNDYLIVEYSFDGISFTPFFAIENDGSTFNSAPFIDTDLDGTGDGAEITDTFTEYSAGFDNNPTTNPGGSTTVDIRVRMRLDSGDEDIAIDNVRITGI